MKKLFLLLSFGFISLQIHAKPRNFLKQQVAVNSIGERKSLPSVHTDRDSLACNILWGKIDGVSSSQRYINTCVAQACLCLAGSWVARYSGDQSTEMRFADNFLSIGAVVMSKAAIWHWWQGR